MPHLRTKLLVLCKTYPSPSAHYVETSCVAAMCEDGSLVRLYPVPFRLLSDHSQFRKWQWIEADIEKARADHRPESFRIRADTIRLLDKPLSTANSWAVRRACLQKLERFPGFPALEQARIERGVTLGLIPSGNVVALDITPSRNPDWSPEEREKLVQQQVQGDLFADREAASLRTLRKVPFSFHYRYRACDEQSGREYRHKIADWEAGALYWNLRHSHGSAWVEPFRQKFGHDLPGRDLMFLMGTIHRFPDQWLIVSVIYPPRLPS